MLMKKELIQFPNEPEPGEPLNPWEVENMDEMCAEEVIDRIFAGAMPDPLWCDHCAKQIDPGDGVTYWRVYDEDQHVAAEITDEVKDEFYGCCEECANRLMVSIPLMPDVQ